MAVTVALLMSMMTVAMAPSAVSAGTVEDEQAFVALINDLRDGQGLAPLIVHTELTAQARVWADTMADVDQLSHAPDMTTGITAPWTVLGENVGVHGAHNIDQLFQAFVSSPTHYQNLIDPRFQYVGVGVVHAPNGKLWTTHRFMATSQPVPSPTTEVTSPPTTQAPTTAPPTTQAPTTRPPTSTPRTPQGTSTTVPSRGSTTQRSTTTTESTVRAPVTTPGDSTVSDGPTTSTGSSDLDATPAPESGFPVALDDADELVDQIVLDAGLIERVLEDLVDDGP